MTEDFRAGRMIPGSREAWLHASTELTGALLTGQSVPDALKLVARRASEVSGAPFVAIALPEGDHLVFETVDHPTEEDFAGRLGTVDDSLIGAVLSGGEPRIVADVWDAATQAGFALPALKELESAILVPLAAGEHVLGALVIARQRGESQFQDADLRFVVDYAAHAALAIDYAKAQQDRRRLAVLEDRDRIARDLHDKVIQRLFSIGLGMQGLTRQVTRPETNRLLGELVEQLDQAIRDIRRSIYSLSDRPL